MKTFCEAREKSSSRMKFLVKLSVTLFILIYCTPAFSGQCEIQIGPGWMKGKADYTPLGKVLAEVTQKAGYAIFIDDQLQETRVSFNIQDKLAPEKAIRRIVRPHSCAVVFGGEDMDNISNILEIWVFRKGQQFTTRYIDLKAASIKGNRAVYSGSPSSVPLLSGSPETVSGVATSGYPKKFVKRDLLVKKNTYGGSFFMHKDPKKGPDYRPTPYQMQESYWKYLTEKKQLELQTAKGIMAQSQRDFERSRNEYWARRNEMIRQSIKNVKNLEKD